VPAPQSTGDILEDLGQSLESVYNVLWWGEDLRLIYNDAWRPVLGQTKHPHALGAPGHEVWPEIWHIIGPMLRGVLDTGLATWQDDQLLVLDRNGYLEEAYFTYSYSSIAEEGGRVGGVFSAVHETTQRVIEERRLRTLRDLAARANDAHGARQACEQAAATMAENPIDIPFALIYLVEPGGESATLMGAAGDVPPKLRPERVRFDEPGGASSWPIASVGRSRQAVVVDAREIADLPGGYWNQPPREALVLPVASAKQDQLAAVFVAGVTPRRALDEVHRTFFDLVSSHIGSSIANARAYEEERKRAEALAELDRAKTVFFSNISHEFRTPLTLILSPTQDALAELTAPRERERLDMIHRNALRLQKLVNTLLDFSRIEAGRIQASYEPMDLAAFTADLASTFRSAVEKAGMALIVRCQPLPEPVYVDRDMWEKIVLNLLSNAFKFTLEGEIEVALETFANRARLVVRDTGSGIAAEHMPRLFERFHRIAGVRARTHEGTGIGLALVKELVTLHGGTIAVHSVLGRGTAFIVDIPLGKDHLPADRLVAARSSASSSSATGHFVGEALSWLESARGEVGEAVSPAPSIGEERFESRADGVVTASPTKPRLLLADDNADMREYLRNLLSAQYDVEAVADGEAALAAALRAPPDLVLTDIMMPNLDGFGLLRALREHPATRATSVILLSARAGEEARIEGLQHGVDDYLVKPFSAGELKARVAATLSLARVRRKAEQSLRDSEARLSAILEQLPIGVGVIDDTGHWTLSNGVMRTFAAKSVPSRDPEQRPRWQAFNPDGSPLNPTQWPGERALRGETVSPGIEFIHKRADGREIYLLVSAVPFRHQGGATTEAIVTLQDIDERKRAEQALQAADRRKDEFLATLAHELRNPLAPIRNVLAIMRLSGGDAPAVDSACAVIERQVGQLVRLVDDLLDVARITTNRLELRKARIDLAEVVQMAVETSRPLIDEHGQDFAIAMPPHPIALDGDLTRLAQVVSNLLNNAAKYTDRGGHIWLTAGQQGREAVVTVRDTGVGIPTEMLPHIFEMFTQVDRSLERSHHGLGIGLTLAKQIVDLHGGTITAYSDGPGTGSAVVIRLPVVQEPAAAPSSAHPAAKQPVPAAARRIMVVDDERISAISLGRLLTLMGHEVRTAHDGLEAVGVAEAFRPDVVLLDIGLPKMNGYDVARKVRQQPWGQGMVLIALTGWGQEADRRRAREAGFDHHLVKPVDPATLTQLLRSL
jgi:signal transduction histidine kinase/DNA-binding response OmpR family regulator